MIVSDGVNAMGSAAAFAAYDGAPASRTHSGQETVFATPFCFADAMGVMHCFNSFPANRLLVSLPFDSSIDDSARFIILITKEP